MKLNVVSVVLLLLLLPAAVTCIAEVSISVKKLDKGAVDITVSGYSDIVLVAQCDLGLFHLSDDKVKQAVAEISGKPDKVYYHDPTPKNTYSERKWKPVKFTLRPRSASVIELYYNQVELEKKNYKNNDITQEKSTIDIKLDSYRIPKAFTHYFSNSDEKCKKNNIIKVTEDLKSLAVLGKALNVFHPPYRYNAATAIATIPAPIFANTTLIAGQTVEVTLSAKLVTVRIEVVYEISLSGDIYCHYKEPLDGKSDWKHSIDTIFRQLVLPRTIDEKTEIKLEFTADRVLKGRDPKTNQCRNYCF